MTADHELLEDTAEDLFEDAPCGYLSTLLDGTIVRVNRTLERWTGLRREDLLGVRRFQELLTPGGQIYHETHYAPLLRMQGEVSEIAVELVRADGSRLPALINSTLRRDASGEPRLVRTTVFDATDRRRYEQELLRAGQRERDIAVELQRSMLAGEPPATAGLAIDVAYRPAVAGMEIGGDWHDAFWTRQGETVALVVGDVVGRGIGAAATMGQLRSALRALAGSGLGPAALLEALDGYVRRYDVGRMATVVCGELDLRTCTLRYACAGHPPPLVVVPGERPAYAWDGRSTPLDAFDRPRPRAEGSLTLAPGAVVALFSDGLVERRERSIDDGLARLAEAVDARRAAPPGGLAAALVEAMRDDEPADDVCLLVARLG